MVENKKIPASLEQAYQAHLAPEKIRIMRIMCSLGILLYLLFSLADIWALPSSLHEAIFIRSVVIVGLVFTYLSTYSDKFITYYNYILPVPYLFAALGIEYMVYISQPTDYATNVYFAGLILVIMILFSWSHLKVLNLVTTTALIIGMYVSIEVSKHKINSISEILPILLPNLFFLCSAAVIGLVTQLIRDSYLRKNFLLQQSLKEAYLEKTKEAETHEHLANHDQLTGLPNSRYANDRLEKNLDRAKELDMSLVIMYLDLNGFKPVNDIYGHKAGDEVLRIVGKRLTSCVRNGDCAARLGGDEFAVGLMVEKNELGIAQEIREKIIQSICQPIGFEGNVLQIGTSVGMASYPSSGDKVSVLIEIADKRMYDAKQRMKKKQLEESEIASEEEVEFTSEQKREPVVIFPGK